MPKLPTYESQRNIGSTQVAPGLSLVEEAGKAGKIVSQSADELYNVWFDAHNKMVATNAQANQAKQSVLIESEWKNDTGLITDSDGNVIFSDNSEKYITKLNDTNNKILENVKDAQTRAQLASKFSLDSQISAIKIQDHFKQQEISFTKSRIPDVLDAEQKIIVDPNSTSAQVENAKLNQVDILNQQVAAGVITPIEADKMLKDSQESAVKFEIYNDMSTKEEDSRVLADLKDPKGRYSYLDQETRLNLIKDSQARIFQNNQTMKRENSDKEDRLYDELFTKWDEGTLSTEYFDTAAKIPEDMGGIPRKQLMQLKKTFQKEVLSDLKTVAVDQEAAAQYLESVDNILSDDTDKNNARELMLKALSDNQMSAQELKFFNSLKKQASDLKDIKNRENYLENSVNPFKKAVVALTSFMDRNRDVSSSEKAMAIKKLINEYMKGTELDVAKTKVLREYILMKNPDISNLPENGQPTMDTNGNIKRMYPDGRDEEYK